MTDSVIVKRRPRNGATWKDEEIEDMILMVKSKVSLQDIAKEFFRSESAVLHRIMTNRTLYNSDKMYIPEAEKWINSHNFFSDKSYIDRNRNRNKRLQ